MRTRIKICGLTRVTDALHAARCGADAIGLVFYPPSPRHVTLEQARAIGRALPAFVTRVALFVDADPAQVGTVLAGLRPDLLQFHGDESPEYCRQFGMPYIKAGRVRAGLDLVQYAALYADAQGLLLDAFVPGQAGGTGQSFDWALIPENLPLPLILSGGLEPENVRHAVQSVHPWAVDVSSGVEISKGIKDAAKVVQFIQEVSNADR
ncbi:N-(5'-phosphoribosyl)anthranilate isomerase [Sulfuriferula plumbiphila]|uniref:N-(5'-phosphoribosyl)anthranilate isomerase n=1 Tax=Sulfuriferula plumbiphila TaxID=171865 RepID=A0A512L6D9_9PROT|nr:phosphoribosylanthranilate isomerase [Sulfuriferula plumbiphila]BBP03643.1 N-(5'-phosphoribosyl)anthranilate isomerase [Sulfuriferula plumbiphila]GEP30044.1 N-(5'-phosphoribosyl)anthranilate isomerase [Sulfuriferula plumbiphila]